MKCSTVARQRQQPVSAQAHVRAADVTRPQAVCRRQNTPLVQKALLAQWLLGKVT
ncbi:MAG TPA: hypothetical protein VMA55_20645 [Acidovorax sp.]|nr:hypothetical protein [Acidovorax sp.]